MDRNSRGWGDPAGRVFAVSVLTALVMLMVGINDADSATKTQAAAKRPAAAADAPTVRRIPPNRCWRVRFEDQIESALGTDLAWGRLGGTFCTTGLGYVTGYSKPRASVRITTAGEISQWDGRVLGKSSSCVPWRGNPCGSAVWRARYKFKQQLGPVSNAEYMRLKIRCRGNRAHRCTGDSKQWG
jgi:hypothetical protein